MLLQNWKTTLTGIGSIGLGLYEISKGNFETGVSSILLGVGMLFAKDATTKG